MESMNNTHENGARGDHKVTGKLTIVFDEDGNAAESVEGVIKLGPAIAKLEIIKARMVAQMIAVEEQARQRTPGIVMASGPIHTPPNLR